MKLKLDEELKTLLGQPIKFSADDNPKTLRDVVLFAVLNEDFAKLAGPEKQKRFELALSIRDAAEKTNFEVEQVAAIKKSVGAIPVFGPAIVGAVYAALEGQSK